MKSLYYGVKKKMFDLLRSNKVVSRMILEEVWEERFRISSIYFKSIKNKYAGKRGFVICNGPSLRMQDLDRIGSDISIASNKIYLAFSKTAWRPDIVSIADAVLWAKIAPVFSQKFPLVIADSAIDPSFSSENMYNMQYIRNMKYM